MSNKKINSIAKNIKAKRKKLGLSQDRLSKLAEVAYNTVVKIDPFSGHTVEGWCIHKLTACKTGMRKGLVVADGKQNIGAAGLIFFFFNIATCELNENKNCGNDNNGFHL